jgi:hypothetical protein
VTLVHLMTEDRTGGGLEAILRAEAQERWAQAGKGHLKFSSKSGTVNGNAQLLDQCRKYELFRFRYKPRLDHVFYVIDARNAWDLPQLRVTAPQPPYEESLPGFITTVRREMGKLARAQWTEVQWEEHGSGFHAHVLVWERESLILPVADRLDLGAPVRDTYAERSAAEAVTALFNQAGKRRAYSKAADGKRLLEQIARDAALRAVVLASNSSLRAIVEELASL